jgi:hypothetical protein
MKWPWGSKFSYDQRKETAKLFLGVCQIVVIALFAAPFVPEFAKHLSSGEIAYGAILITLLYLTAMKFLSEIEK